MNLWADYMKERFGWETITEEDMGFISYSIALPFCAIQNVYIAPEHRRSNLGLSLFNRVVARGKKAGATYLWTQVQLDDFGKERALRANLALGFQVLKADNKRIIMTRSIEG